MPKPLIFNMGNKTNTGLDLQMKSNTGSKTALDDFKLDKLLRKKRSGSYVKAMTRLDTGGHSHNKAQVEEMINAIRSELPEVEICGTLIGIVAKCYLGDSYEVHTLDIAGCIIEHYMAGEPLPGRLETARSLAMNRCYEFIEVYTDRLCAVTENGDVSVVK